ncbi:MAG: hypothetical protein KC621_20625 [Myxococcales bacterium]|nr:hypothetical protein [Myxococcales bacterium]
MIVFVASLTTSAWAQQDAALCKGGFSEQDLGVRLESIDTAIVTAETAVARRLADKTVKQLGCLERVIGAEHLATLGFQLALLAYQDQDETAALRWVRMARQASPESDWPTWLSPAHPLRQLHADAGPPSPSAGAGRMVPPKGGGLFVDGSFADEVSGFEDVPAFLQVADVTGTVIQSQWVEADQFPADWVGSPGAPPSAPRWWTEDGFDPTKARRAPNDRAPIVPIVATTGLALTSGTLYLLSALSVSGLEQATTESELAGARTRTNTLAMGSLVTGVGAVGAGVTVVLAADGGGLGFGFRF